MGITPLHARLIVEEHRRRPLPQTIHLLGRQTVHLTADGADRLIRSCGLDPCAAPSELDVQTRGAVALQEDYISDRMFFGLLGVRSVVAIDYADYEGAELIIDLNKPLAPEHAGTVDFLFGGSVLDNIFDGTTYVRNIAKLLRVGGRFLDQNTLSQVQHPYLLVTPGWTIDYYVINQFSRIEVYVSEHSASGFVHMYGVAASAAEMISDFGPPRGTLALGVISIVEKGERSTSDLTPIQDQYRNNADWTDYRRSLSQLAHAASWTTFSRPTAQELVKLGVRRSKSYRYLGVVDGACADPLILDSPLPDPRTVGGLRIVEATYGGAMMATAPEAAGVCAAYRGNVTDIVASLANGEDRWEWMVDVQVLGDPRPREGKDLEILFYYPDEPGAGVRRVHLEAEAHGKTVALSRAEAG